MFWIFLLMPQQKWLTVLFIVALCEHRTHCAYPWELLLVRSLSDYCSSRSHVVACFMIIDIICAVSLHQWFAFTYTACDWLLMVRWQWQAHGRHCRLSFRHRFFISLSAQTLSVLICLHNKWMRLWCFLTLFAWFFLFLPLSARQNFIWQWHNSSFFRSLIFIYLYFLREFFFQSQPHVPL